MAQMTVKTLTKKIDEAQHEIATIQAVLALLDSQSGPRESHWAYYTRRTGGEELSRLELSIKRWQGMLAERTSEMEPLERVN